MKSTPEMDRPTHLLPYSATTPQQKRQTSPLSRPGWMRSLWEVLRFGLVGGLNTAIDLLILNGLLLLFPTQSTITLLMYNSVAYGVGAINSFVLNKYWTFRHQQRTTPGELVRFALTTCAGIVCNDAILWLLGNVLHPAIANTTLWANTSKILAVFGTASLSYLGMRLWVFVKKPQEVEHMRQSFSQLNLPVSHEEEHHTPSQETSSFSSKWRNMKMNENTFLTKDSLSIVLPAHNEEQVIAHTLADVLDVLTLWVRDFEILVVNDGSTDLTGAIVTAIAAKDTRVKLITHPLNLGYGAALVSGFEAASKQLTFFMDSDGQFDIRDLQEFFPLIDTYDAVIGYRMDRQDTVMRKLNAWGWKQVVRVVLGISVRDIDCAFKLLHTDFLHQHPLETRGAMINAELLYKLTHAGCTYYEVGVMHLPRRAGRATGAKLSVIARAFRELFTSAWKWRREQESASTARLQAQRQME